ncbi:hypothetical protein PR048_002230 [Dryococelus australis]|uniref:Uncharacterized protein n=1 Tax=Dryococelus australis TaxID=614101 RepID=A0ABQ9IJK8_9NEOP|nr:hypothetical protein PR048_002230 [Dryococelus australis]
MRRLPRDKLHRDAAAVASWMSRRQFVCGSFIKYGNVVNNEKLEGTCYSLFSGTDSHMACLYRCAQSCGSTTQNKLINEDISSCKCYFRDCVPPGEKLVITLRYLAPGCSFADLHYVYRLGKSTMI